MRNLGAGRIYLDPQRNPGPEEPMMSSGKTRAGVQSKSLATSCASFHSLHWVLHRPAPSPHWPRLNR